jgi:hypothetical protein
MIHLKLDKEEYSLGDLVSGNFSFEPENSTKVKKVVVSCGWKTEGRGNEDKYHYSQQDFMPSDIDVTQPFSSEFALPIPQEGPCSYEGFLLRVVWHIELQIVIPWAKDLKKSHTFTVLRNNG